jgi:ligand-binding sensor domain-containing protein
VPDTARSRLWIPSNEGLLYIALDASPLQIQRDSFLPFTTIQSGLLDDRSILWLTTPEGLVAYQPDTKRLRRFQQSDGLQGSSFHFASAFKGKAGDLLFGGVNGVSIVDEEKVTPISTPAYATLSQLEIKECRRIK